MYLDLPVWVPNGSEKKGVNLPSNSGFKEGTQTGSSAGRYIYLSSHGNPSMGYTKTSRIRYGKSITKPHQSSGPGPNSMTEATEVFAGDGKPTWDVGVVFFGLVGLPKKGVFF